MRPLDEFERDERLAAYHRWFRRQAAALGYYQLPPSCRATVARMLRAAYAGGADQERQAHEPVHVGGNGWD